MSRARRWLLIATGVVVSIGPLEAQVQQNNTAVGQPTTQYEVNTAPVAVTAPSIIETKYYQFPKFEPQLPQFVGGQSTSYDWIFRTKMPIGVLWNLDGDYSELWQLKNEAHANRFTDLAELLHDIASSPSSESPDGITALEVTSRNYRIGQLEDQINALVDQNGLRSLVSADEFQKSLGYDTSQNPGTFAGSEWVANPEVLSDPVDTSGGISISSELVNDPQSNQNPPLRTLPQPTNRRGDAFWNFFGDASQLFLDLQAAGASGKGPEGASSEKKNYRCSWGACTLAQWQKDKSSQVPVPPPPHCGGPPTLGGGTGVCGVAGQQ